MKLADYGLEIAEIPKSRKGRWVIRYIANPSRVLHFAEHREEVDEVAASWLNELPRTKILNDSIVKWDARDKAIGTDLNHWMRIIPDKVFRTTDGLHFQFKVRGRHYAIDITREQALAAPQVP